MSTTSDVQEKTVEVLVKERAQEAASVFLAVVISQKGITHHCVSEDGLPQSLRDAGVTDLAVYPGKGRWQAHIESGGEKKPITCRIGLGDAINHHNRTSFVGMFVYETNNPQHKDALEIFIDSTLRYLRGSAH